MRRSDLHEHAPVYHKTVVERARRAVSFYKHYPHRKDWRAPYRDSRRFDRGCGNHGSCPYCAHGRLHADRKWRSAADQQLEEPYYSHPCEDGTCPSCFPGVSSFDPDLWPGDPRGHT